MNRTLRSLEPLTAALVGLALGALLLQSGCDREADAAAGGAGAATSAARSVELHRVGRHTIHDHIELSANIQPHRMIKLVPRVPGVLEKVLVEEGDRVEEGQVVAQLERRDYLLGVKQAQAQLAAALANAELAALGVESADTARGRMKQLREREAISQSELEKVDESWRMGQANEGAALAQTQLAKVGLEAARVKLADTVLRAPFAGLVIKRLLEEGDLCGVMPPGIVMVIADVGQMEVTGSVSELQVGRIDEGTPATVRVDAFPGETFTGTVQVVSPMVDPQTRTAEVKITVPNADGRLDSGMSARITVDLGERQVLAVPEDVLLRGGGGRDQASVFVVDEGNLARRRDVELGDREGAVVEVRSGLAEGDRVVRSGQTGLRDGQPVRPSEPATPR